MPDFIDSLNRLIHIEKTPERIISLVPSVTELLFDLGLEKQIAGITRYCIHPENSVKNIKIIGGTENIDFEKVKEISPDLIICSKEENKEKEISILMEKYNVFVSDVKNFNQAISFIYETGLMTGKEEKAKEIIREINRAFSELPEVKIKTRAVYLIWKNPYMTINGDTFISDMLNIAGFENVFRNKIQRYPVINIEEIEKAKPHIIFLSSEPYAFKEKDRMELVMTMPFTEIMNVDGEFFSWYGSRMIKAAEYFKKLSLLLQY